MTPAKRHAIQAEPELSDVELVNRARIGRVEAFAALYDRHAGKILGLARRLLGAGPDADDLVHDVFLEAWQNIRSYDPTRASVLTWLSVRTRSRAADRLARRSRERQARMLLDVVEERGESGSVPIETLLATRTALAQLESPTRSALQLMYVGGLTAPEISRQIGVAEGTVRSRIARGLSLLERALRPGAARS